MVPFTLMMATSITIPNGMRQCECPNEYWRLALAAVAI